MRDLEEARALKFEVLAGLAGPPNLSPYLTRRMVIPDAIQADYLGLTPRHFAVGISFHAERGYRVAARVHTGLLSDANVAELLRGAARPDVDVEVIGPVRALSAGAAARCRPLRRGVSIGHPTIGTGTLGAFVRERAGSVDPLILSNHHVLVVGRPAAGQPIWQPGPHDGGAPSDDIATLARWILLDTAGPNRVDAATATVRAGVAIDPTLPSRITGIESPVDQVVEKWGRSSGQTHGRITAFEVDGINVTYGNGREYRFDGQIEISGTNAPFSTAGDSGALVTTAAACAVALLFAGASSGGPDGLGVSYANPIDVVLSALALDLVT